MWTPFKAKATKAYWWKEVPNFGDALAPLLLEHFADVKVEWGTISHSQIASVGSILEHILFQLFYLIGEFIKLGFNFFGF